jgi:ribosomal protein S7
MPRHSVEQAKTMSAIAHGWRPTGSAADIPVKVAKEFHAADKGKKYGAKKKASPHHLAKALARG